MLFYKIIFTLFITSLCLCLLVDALPVMPRETKGNEKAVRGSNKDKKKVVKAKPKATETNHQDSRQSGAKGGGNMKYKSNKSKSTKDGDKEEDYYDGSGTYFDPPTQGGDTGACGPKESASSDVVALNPGQYGPMNKKSKLCGKKVLIKYGQKKAVATVEDACPGCHEKSLDMTPKVFSKLADPKQGNIPVEWCFLDDKKCK